MCCHKTRAFSLVELILVVAIIGVVSAIAMPRLGSVLDTHRVDQAASKLANDLELLRTAARASTTTTQLTVSGKNSTWRLSGLADTAPGSPESTVNLTQAPYFATFDNNLVPDEYQLTFDANGVPSETFKFVIRSGAQSRFVTVYRPGGAIVIAQ